MRAAAAAAAAAAVVVNAAAAAAAAAAKVGGGGSRCCSFMFARIELWNPGESAALVESLCWSLRVFCVLCVFFVLFVLCVLCLAFSSHCSVSCLGHLILLHSVPSRHTQTCTHQR